jgi:hypothetical protein
VEQQVDEMGIADHAAHPNHQLCFNQTSPCLIPHLLLNPVPYTADEARGDAHFDAMLGEKAWILIIVELMQVQSMIQSDIA